MQKKMFLRTFISCLFAIPLLVGCGGGGQSSSATPTSSAIPGSSEKPKEDDTVFIEGTREVTKTKVEIYPGPSTMTSSNKCSVKVEDKDVFVYETLVNYNRQFSWSLDNTTSPVVLFDFEGKVHVEVTVNANEPITSASISPLAYDIPITISENKLSFDLQYQTNYVLTYNDDYKTAIHIFTNGIEQNPITPDQAALDESIVYIGPGVYKADALPVKDGCTIYLAGGAYVYGSIHAEIVENVTIRGHGIISGDIYTRTSDTDFTVPVVMRNAKHIVLEDITFLNPAGWVLNIYKCEDVKINNVKMITARQNGDGISIQSCKDVTVTGGFVRTWDDSLVVKNNDLGTTENVSFDGVTVWTDLAQSMEVGYETHGAYMKNITFKNITVLHNFHKAAISMHNCDEAEISNVKYENITIEHAAMFGDTQDDGENDFFIDFTIAYNPEWTESGGERGSIDGVTIHNVKVLKEDLCKGQATIKSRMLGEGVNSMIKNVDIKGIKINGNNITNKEDLKLTTNEYTQNINITSEKVHGAEIQLPYKLKLDGTPSEVIVNKQVQQDGILTPEFSWQKGDRPFIGNAASVEGFTSAATHGTGTTNKSPADDGSGRFDLDTHTSSMAIDVDKTTYLQNAEWKGQTDEFMALTMDFNKAVTVGTLRIIGKEDNPYYFDYAISVWVKKAADKAYVRSVGIRNYEMSPIRGNCIDINLTAQDYYGIQLRFFKENKTTSAKDYMISEVEFYQPSLAFNKAIVDSTEHNDVYTINRVNDGDPTGTSYYESKSVPAYFIIDLGDVYQLQVFGLFLPPSLSWSARTEEIEILVSDYNNAYESEKVNFTTAVAKKAYLFDPSTGNNNIITMNGTVSARFIKVVIYSNSDKGGYGGQLSEFTCYAGSNK